MCLYPKLINNRKYMPNKKNGGIVPHLHEIKDKRVLAVPRACGRCMECRRKTARDWQVRMLEDIRHEKNGIMVTLTFSNKSITELKKELDEEKKITKEWIASDWIRRKEGKPYKKWKKHETKATINTTGYELDNAIATLATRRFNERWRKKYGKAIRHWLVTELGHQGTENVHMHGIVWTNEHKKAIEERWQYGYVWTGTYCNEQSVNYTVKYIHKQDKQHTEYKPKVLTSDGIGEGYLKRLDAELNKYKGDKTREFYRQRTGHKMSLPVYYRNKIYTDEEKEKLWIQKLDEQIRWVNGIKIDISEGEEMYYEVLVAERQKSKRLGYQDDEINWNKKRYEEERRTLLQQERILKAEESLRGLGDAPESAESVNSFASLSWAQKKNQW